MSNSIDFGAILTDSGFDFFTASPAAVGNPVVQHAENLGLYYRVSSEPEVLPMAFGASLCKKLPVVVFKSEGVLKTLPWMTTIDAAMEAPFLGIIELDTLDFHDQGWAARHLEDLVCAVGGRIYTLPDSLSKAATLVNDAYDYMRNTKKPCFIRVKRADLKDVAAVPKLLTPRKMGLYTAADAKQDVLQSEAIKILSKEKRDSFLVLPEDALGRAYYKNGGDDHRTLFLGGRTSFASVAALSLSYLQKKSVIVVDKMSDLLGSINPMVTNGFHQKNNLLHIVLDVEDQLSKEYLRISKHDIDLPSLAKSLGYPQVVEAGSLIGFGESIKRFYRNQELTLLYIRVKSDLEMFPQIPISPIENKQNFMESLDL